MLIYYFRTLFDNAKVIFITDSCKKEFFKLNRGAVEGALEWAESYCSGLGALGISLS